MHYRVSKVQIWIKEYQEMLRKFRNTKEYLDSAARRSVIRPDSLRDLPWPGCSWRGNWINTEGWWELLSPQSPPPALQRVGGPFSPSLAKGGGPLLRLPLLSDMMSDWWFGSSATISQPERFPARYGTVQNTLWFLPITTGADPGLEPGQGRSRRESGRIRLRRAPASKYSFIFLSIS